MTSDLYLSAGSPDITGEQMSTLAFCISDRVRMHMAEHGKLSTELIRYMAEDPSHVVRIAIACNPNTPSAVLLKLAFDEHPDVRFAMAENHSLPPLVLEILARDENPYVENRARRTLEHLGYLHTQNKARKRTERRHLLAC